MSKKVIIVGGVAGGASTAARLRRLDENLEIIMIEKGEYISFANCGLPYYIGDKINDRRNLIVETVEDMSKKFNLDIRNLSEVVSIDRTNKKIGVKKVKSGEYYEESYDVLVLSPGAKPIKPNIKGIENCENLFTLRNIPDTDKIKDFINEKKPRKATIIGGGFIGLEMAENLHELGLDLTIIEASSQVMAPLDIEMVSTIHQHLIDKGVKLILEDGVTAFNNDGRSIELSSGMRIETDIIILSIGVRPESTIATEAGLKVNERGAIIVDEYMKTSDESIYALGDAVEILDFVSKKPTMIPLAWPANRQGRIVADNITGKMVKYRGTLGSSVAKVFDYTVATTGNNEKTLKRYGINYKVVHIHPNSHAGYYPGAFPIAYKMLFDPRSGKIFGAQGVGFEGVEKRIDVIATSIKAGLSVFDLQDFEPCYAPPYNSAKDPVNLMGYYASNIIEGNEETIQWYELDNIKEEDSIILDVREEFELVTGVLENSLNIPLGNLRENLDMIPKNKKIYTTCQVGLRGYIASRILSQKGYKCINIDGGIKTYKNVKNAEEAIKNQGGNEMSIQREVASTNLDDKIDENIKETVSLNACGLQCPGPIKRVYEEIGKMEDGDILRVAASDPGFGKDIKTWCDKTGNTLMKADFENDRSFVAYIKKGGNTKESCSLAQQPIKDGATLVVFSGDLDKAIASFIIATGAASMGKKVTMFFTFWGLNILKSKDRPKAQKNTMEKMFDVMLPSNTSKLPLSKMNMMGMGPAMIKKIMKDNNVDDIDTLIKNAIDMGVNVVACSMSMDLMGIKKEEFIDGVEVGGVASYLGAAEDSGLNLFI